MTDEALRERWRMGDALAYEELFRRWSGRVAAFVARMLGDAHRAEEITQEVFMRVVTHAGSFDGQEAKFSTWIFQIARNLSLNEVRDLRRRGEEPLGESVVEHSAANPPDRRMEEVGRALQQLPEEQRSVFVLKHDQDLKYEEIATALNIPVGTVKSRMHTAVGTLRTLLREVRP